MFNLKFKIMDNIDRQFEIETLLRENGIYPEFVEMVGENSVEVRIDGDWKHDHRFADLLMTQNGYTYVGSKDDNPSDSDWGCYTHIYTYQE